MKTPYRKPDGAPLDPLERLELLWRNELARHRFDAEYSAWLRQMKAEGKDPMVEEGPKNSYRFLPELPDDDVLDDFCSGQSRMVRMGFHLIVRELRALRTAVEDLARRLDALARKDRA